MQEWAAKLLQPMGMHRIKWGDIAKQAGLSYQYVSQVINGKYQSKEAQTRIETAVAELIAAKEIR